MSSGLSALSVFVEGLDHPEGLCVTKDGDLYAGGEAGQVYRISDGVATEIANTGGFLLGLAADGDGRLYCCDVARREVLRVDPRDGSVRMHSAGTVARPMGNPNWGVFDDAGNYYVTDSGHWKQNDGCIFRVSPSGATSIWSEEPSNFPNGACLSADGSELLVLESCTPALVRIPIAADGTAGAREVVAKLEGAVPDGVTLDDEGRAYVFNYRPDRIDRVWPDGRVEVLAEDPEGTLLSAPTNGVWIGEGRCVTGNLGRWHLTLCEWNGVRGVPLRYPVLP